MWSRWLVTAPVILLYYQIVLILTSCLDLEVLLVVAAFTGPTHQRSSEFISRNINNGNSHHIRYSEQLSDTFSNSFDSISDNRYDPQSAPPSPAPHRSHNFKISPKPCSIGSIDGTCMFVWECIKSEGQHVGMCVDSFMFGSCCTHNLTQNVVLPQTFSFTRPPSVQFSSAYQPSLSSSSSSSSSSSLSSSSLSSSVSSSSSLLSGHPHHHKPRPPSSISGMTTIERPHGAGTLVIRPSGPHHQTAITHHHGSSNYYQPQHVQQKPIALLPSTLLPSSSSSIPVVPGTTKGPILTNSLFDMETSSSVSSIVGLWNTSPHTVQWHMTTEPNFITKPRPPVWEKPSKPVKPSKKPIQTQAHYITYSTRRPPTTGTSTSMKTKPQTLATKPTRPIVTNRPYTPSPSSSTKPSSSTSTTVTYKPAPSLLSSFIYPSTSVPSSSISSFSTSSLSPPSSSSSSFSPSTSSTSSTSSSTTTTTTVLFPSSIPHSSPSSSAFTAQYRPTTKPSTALTSTSLAPIRKTPPPLNFTTIESNEIPNHVTNDPPIKTISAARGECGVPTLLRPETRIVGGKNAPFGRWPWQVSVRRTSFFGFSSTHRCGGALINENWIATAGHCVDDLLTSQIRIRVGEYDFSHVQEQLPYIERSVAKKVVHPKYNFFTYEYDLALVKLEQPLEFAPHVSPICLPSTDSLMIGMNATVTGWGRLSEGGTLPSVLQEVSVPIVSNDRCKSMFLRAGRQEFIPDIFLCAGYETGGQDSCQGDSGGPLQVKSDDGRYFLAGIISWGIGCAEANLPGVCTRISKFVPWIMENVV